jgi:hypothetical protein
MQQVIVTIENGMPTVTVKGCKGSTCKKLTKELEGNLGDVKETKATAEFYEQAKQNNQASR